MDLNLKGFVVAIYAASVPSVDFNTAEKIDCTAHKLSMSQYETILKDFAGDDVNKIMACNMFMLANGPQLVD